MKVNILLLLLTAVISVTTFSQATDAAYLASHPRVYTKRYCFWMESNFNFNLTKDKRWQVQMDYQYRRTSDPSYVVGGSKNPFKDNFQQVYRPWVHYWLVPGQVRLSLSPIAYWSSWVSAEEARIYKPTVGSHGTYGSTQFPEFRITPMITTIQKFGRIEFSNRLRYEFRFVGQRTLANNNITDYSHGLNFDPDYLGSPMNDSTGISRTQRLRYQVRVLVPLTKADRKHQLYINAWNEVFLSFGKMVGTSKVLNQNRTIAMLGYRPPSKRIPMKFELGVTEQILFAYNITNPPTQPSTVNYNKQNVELNTAITLFLVFDNLDMWFRKKDKTAKH